MAGFLTAILIFLIGAIVAASNGDPSGIYGILKIIGTVAGVLFCMWLFVSAPGLTIIIIVFIIIIPIIYSVLK